MSLAFLTALEVLGPTQRAVLVLRDVLDYSVQETAAALELSEANVKTALHRARKALESYDASALPLTPERIARTREALRALCVHLLSHNVPALESLLAREVSARNDGGGEFFAAQRPILGLARVIKFHLRTAPRRPGRLAIREVNGLPALVFEAPSRRRGVAPRAVVHITLDADDRIATIHTILATAKLRAVDFASLRTPGLRELVAMVRAAMTLPPPLGWLKELARRGWTQA